MRGFVRWAAALVISLASVTWAMALSPADTAALQRAASRGEQIYAYDQAAWITTDVLLERLPDPGKAGVRGWVVSPKGDGLTVIYYGLKDDVPFAVFSGDVKGRKVTSSKVFKPGDDATLTAEQLSLIAAADAAKVTTQRSCTRGAFNRVILPPETQGGNALVYILTPQVERDIYPFGGHFLIEVGPDGKVASSRGFTRSCINLSAAPEGGDSVAGLVITHLLDPTPTEIHVWLSLWTRKPIFVATGEPDRFWSVTGTEITLEKDGD